MKPTKNLKAQLTKTALNASGSAKTRHARQLKLGQFTGYLKKYNIQITRIEQIKAKYIEVYMKERLNQGIQKRTLQNDMAAICQTLKAAGREQLAHSDRISNQALGLSSASRPGTRTAISDNHYQEIYQKSLTTKPEIAALQELSRALGLRGEEAVQSCQSLKTWQKDLNRGKSSLKVVFGTKGGRSRETTVIDRNRVIRTVNAALQIASQQNGKLINKPNLKEAMTWWRNQTTRLGLTGKHSPHSLRYAFAQDVIRHHQAQGHTLEEALALTSMDLGHGDGRGRYIKQVYG